MNYPLISEYTEAILSAEDNFNELVNLRPVLDNNGRPIMSSGNFAVVYKMRDIESSKFYAVKCFTREQSGRDDSYTKISEYINKTHANYLVAVTYYPNELFVDTDQSNSNEFPILLMEWIDGVTLEEYIIKNSANHETLEKISLEFVKFVTWLLPKHFAHGDLKPDNIIIDINGKIRLIDYDGMYVPSMEGQISPELGTPKFQHRHRKSEDFNEYIDDYGALYIALLLRIIVLDNYSLEEAISLEIPELIEKISHHIEDSITSKLLAAFLLTYNRGFIEREVLSICTFDDNQYDRNRELKLIYQARTGDTQSMIYLGETYSAGSFTPKNPSKAIDWLYLARAMGNINASCDVCKHYYHFDYDYFVFSIDNPIHKGLLNRSNDFSLCRQGEVIYSNNKEEAIKFFKEASLLGFAPAIKWLANSEPNHELKIQLLKTAASSNYVTALKRLGDIYRKGEENLQRDIEEALKYYELAAKAGDSDAQYYIGLAYLYGSNGYVKSIKDAIKWFSLAAEQRHSKAICILARMYIVGKKIPQDFDYAFQLLERSRNNPEALFIWGFCYQHGFGVKKNIEQAIAYYSQSINTHPGYTQSEIELDKILRTYRVNDETFVNPSEISAAGDTNTETYSSDGKRFLAYWGSYGLEYKVNDGTKVLCDNAFNDLYSETEGHFLQSISLPESLVRIGNNVFCSSINEITFKRPSVRFKIENKMLLSRDGKILYRYFGENQTVEIPETVEYIKGGAFTGMRIKKITIPKSVKYIGANPFAEAGYFDSKEKLIHPTIISESPFIIVDGESLYSKSENILIACWSEGKIRINNGCQYIGENAFWTAGLSIIYLPTSVIAIHETAFWGFRMNLEQIIVNLGDAERFKSIIPQPYKDLVRELRSL